MGIKKIILKKRNKSNMEPFYQTRFADSGFFKLFSKLKPNPLQNFGDIYAIKEMPEFRERERFVNPKPLKQGRFVKPLEIKFKSNKNIKHIGRF